MAINTDTTRVLVVGAGIAGPTLAVALHRLGHEVELAEVQSVWKPVGAGLTLMGPALRTLQTIGLIDPAVKRGAGLHRLVVGNERTEITATVELPQLNGPSYPSCVQLSRPAFHDVLAGSVRACGLKVRLDTTVDAIESHDEEVDVSFADGERRTYDLVVGADGAHSRIRALAFPELDPPRLTGQATWRAMVDRPPELGSTFEDGNLYMFYGPRNKALVIPTSERQLYIALVENVAERTRPADDALPEMIREQLVDYSGFLASLRDLITTPGQVTRRDLEVLLVPAPWHRGRILLIGDAAHTTTPHLASGAGIAIEDAVVLAEELAADGSIPAALDRFMRRRFERCRMVVENSERLGEWEQRPEPDADPVALTNASWAQLEDPV
jgi:2-polyprenyl-6-methoxyphenol hydroxylase-like FAD-dependent oxidoreductase